MAQRKWNEAEDEKKNAQKMMEIKLKKAINGSTSTYPHC